jgi:hypothetical protein
MSIMYKLLRPKKKHKLPVTPLKQSLLLKMRSLHFSKHLERPPSSSRAKTLKSKPPAKKPLLSAPLLSEKATEEL